MRSSLSPDVSLALKLDGNICNLKASKLLKYFTIVQFIQCKRFRTGLLFERFTVNTFNLVRGILRCETYRPAKTVEGTPFKYSCEVQI